MDITIQWFWLIGLTVSVVQASLIYWWYKKGFNKKIGILMVIVFAIVFIIGTMIKIEPVTAAEYHAQQYESISSTKTLPAKITDNSFENSVKNTKSIDTGFIPKND